MAVQESPTLYGNRQFFELMGNTLSVLGESLRTHNGELELSVDASNSPGDLQALRTTIALRGVDEQAAHGFTLTAQAAPDGGGAFVTYEDTLPQDDKELTPDLIVGKMALVAAGLPKLRKTSAVPSVRPVDAHSGRSNEVLCVDTERLVRTLPFLMWLAGSACCNAGVDQRVRALLRLNFRSGGLVLGEFNGRDTQSVELTTKNPRSGEEAAFVLNFTPTPGESSSCVMSAWLFRDYGVAVERGNSRTGVTVLRQAGRSLDTRYVGRAASGAIVVDEEHRARQTALLEMAKEARDVV